MTLYFDLDLKQFVKPPGESGIVRSVTYVRGDDEGLNVHFLRAGVDVTDVTQIAAVIKAAPGPSAVALASCENWTLATTNFVGQLDMNGSDLNTLIAAKTSLNLLFEITCYQGGQGPITAEAVKCIVRNDLWRGNETTPATLQPDPAVWMPAPLLRTAAEGDPNGSVAIVTIPGETIPDLYPIGVDIWASGNPTVGTYWELHDSAPLYWEVILLDNGVGIGQWTSDDHPASPFTADWTTAGATVDEVVVETPTAIGQLCIVGDDSPGNGNRLTYASDDGVTWTLKSGRKNGLAVTVSDNPHVPGEIILAEYDISLALDTSSITPDTFLTV